MLERCDFYIQPRQTGKTSELINKVKNDKRSALLIVPNTYTRRHILHKECSIYNHVISVSDLIKENLKGLKGYDTVCVDEYLFLRKDVIAFLNTKLPLHFSKIIIKTTSNKLYDKRMFEFVRAYRKLSNPPKLSFPCMNFEQDQFFELYYNLLTHPKTNLWKFDYLQTISEEKYKTEILGELFKGDKNEYNS